MMWLNGIDVNKKAINMTILPFRTGFILSGKTGAPQPTLLHVQRSCNILVHITRTDAPKNLSDSVKSV